MHPPNGFYTSTWQWLGSYDLQNRSKYYKFFEADEKGVGRYQEPKGLDNPVHWKFRIDFQTEPLKLLNLPKKKVIECHKQFHLKADRLVVPSLEKNL